MAFINNSSGFSWIAPNVWNSNFADSDFNKSRSNFTCDKMACPRVNISEDTENYRLDLCVPGLNREDFQISIEDDLLIVNGENEEEVLDKGQVYKRREFSFSNFSRSFILPENIVVRNIKASYKDGVLSINIPKKMSEQKTQKKIIEVL
jgi:HSP20 family protein